MDTNERQIKIPTTLDEQIELLKKRGCNINDEEKAKDFLRRVGYYRFSGYFHIFKQADNSFADGVTFSKLESAYSFDQELRALVIRAVSEVEVTAKSVLSYHHSHLYGADGYRNADSFNEKHNHTKFVGQLDSNVKLNKATPFVKHHLTEYNGQFPLWVATELFTMGMVSLFYADMKLAEKKAIAKEYGTDDIFLASWLHSTTVLRNTCAHYGRLYPTAFRFQPRLPKYYTKNKGIGAYSLGRQLCMLKLLHISAKQEWNNGFVLPLAALIEKYDDAIDRKLMGLPDDWEKILNW